MFSLTKRCDTMDGTSEELYFSLNSNSEFYLLLIVVKLAILMVFTIGQAIVRLYAHHNKRVVDRYNRASVAARILKLTSKICDDLEAGPSIK